MANRKLRGAEAALHERTPRETSQDRTSYDRGQDGDPRYHTQRLRAQLTDMIGHLREDVEKFDEPQLKAMFETSAEVLSGLAKALDDYDRKREPACRR